MSTVSIADEKNYLPKLVHQAEVGIGEFLKSWQADAERLDAFADGSEFEGLRDNAPGRDVVFERARGICSTPMSFRSWQSARRTRAWSRW